MNDDVLFTLGAVLRIIYDWRLSTPYFMGLHLSAVTASA